MGLNGKFVLQLNVNIIKVLLKRTERLYNVVETIKYTVD